MKPALEAEKICNALEDLSKGKLKYREDLLRIIELALHNDKMNMLEELSFNAKYLQGLVKIIQTRSDVVDQEYLTIVEKEYTEGITKVKSIIQNILENSGSFLQTIFQEKYFTLTPQSLSNLNNFCNDLSFLKLYFNDLKSGSK